MDHYTLLRETALHNFDKLLNYWGVSYQKIGEIEYDFINPTRDDTDFGACRFNIKKGIGADFAGHQFSAKDFSSFGPGFTKEDFSWIGEAGADTNSGFDIIGLCGRLHKINNYKESAGRLALDIKDIDNNVGIVKPTRDIIKKKQQQLELENLTRIRYANETWERCSSISNGEASNSIGRLYLQKRGIRIQINDKIKFHRRIINKEAGRPLPTLLFRISKEPNGELTAIHRIYLDEDGNKANINTPKMALGPIKGAGIWFGEIKDKLYIAEGPENALSLLCMGKSPVVSTINATNFPNLSIPENVKIIVLCPDNDKAGIYNTKKALKTYAKKGRKIIVKFPRQGKDWNDILLERQNG